MPAINLISAVPSHVSQDEYRKLVESTPASFSDLPAVLKLKEDNVSCSLDPPLDNFQTEGNGMLYILTSVLVYMSSNGQGFQIEYPSITLHAISRSESGPSIYCQLDEGVQTHNEEDEEASEMRELTIFPQNAESLEPIFEALSQCASLHPDETNSDEIGPDDAFIDADSTAFEVFTGDEEQELSEVGRAALAHLDSIIYDPHQLVSEQPSVVDEDVVDPSQQTK